MIAKFLAKSKTLKGVRYNTNKVEKDKGELMKVSGFRSLQGMPQLLPQDYINYLNMVSAANKRVVVTDCFNNSVLHQIAGIFDICCKFYCKVSQARAMITDFIVQINRTHRDRCRVKIKNFFSRTIGKIYTKTTGNEHLLTLNIKHFFSNNSDSVPVIICFKAKKHSKTAFLF
jgi:hypothetical protein